MSEINQQIVDVIIVTYHSGNILLQAIESVFALKHLNKLILINNGNPPELNTTLNQIKNDRFKMIFGHGNIGFAAGCNMGANISNADYLLFLNPDCIINDKYLLIKFIDSLKSLDYQVATALILNSDGTIQKTCRRNLLTPLIGLSESFNLYKIFPYFKPLNLPIEEIDNLPNISPVPALSGAVVFITKNYYNKIKGFDEIYFIHVEDMDLCMKIHLTGDKIAFVKNIIITHILSTSNVTNKFLEYHKAKGFMIYMQKFFPCCRGIIIGNIFKLLIWLRYFLKIKFFLKKFNNNN